MAGALKHMERSHRSYKNKQNAFVFTQFTRKAYTNKYMRDFHKERKKTLGQRVSSLVKKLMPQKREG